MAERAYQLPEPPPVIQLYPDAPVSIASHPNYKFHKPCPTVILSVSEESHGNQPKPTRWEVPEDFEGIMAFNPRHYIQAYLDLQAIENQVPQQKYQELLEQQNRLTLHDLGKTILERLVASKSTIKYHIKNGKLINDDFGEPALERFERGQKWLEQNGSNEVQREKAEIAGMYKVEALLASGQDITIVVVSARSEGCKHGEEKDPKDEQEDILYHQQYINVFEQKAGTITLTQLHSTHDYDGLLSALQQIDPQYPQPQQRKPDFMLANPAISKLPIGEMLQKFAVDKNTMPPKECAEVMRICTPIFLSFIETLINDPLNIIQIKKTVNTIYNLADETEEKIKRRKLQQAKTIAKNSIEVSPRKGLLTARRDLDPNIRAAMSASQLIDIYGSQQAKTKGGACPGKQKGFKISLGGALQQITKLLGGKSVVDFAKMLDDDEDEDTSDFACGGTKENGESCSYIVKYGSGTTQCPECGRKAVCA